MDPSVVSDARVDRHRLGTRLRAAGALAGTVVAIHLALSLAASREFRRESEALRAAGLPLAYAEILPSPVPTEEDAAPLLTRVFIAMSDARRPYDQGRSFSYPSKGMSALTSWLDADPTHPSPREREARDWLATPECASIAALTHEAAERPHCRFGSDLAQAYDARLPQFEGTRYAAKLVLARAELAGADWGDAIADVLALGSFLREEPIVISQLIATSVDARALRLLRRGLAEGRVPVSAQALLIARLARSGCELASMVPALDAKRVTYAKAFTRPPDDPGTGPERLLGGLYGSVIGYPLRVHDHACFQRLLGQGRLDLARDGFAADPDPQLVAGVLAPVTRMLMPSVSMFARNLAVHHARVDLARLALALVRFRADHGAYPAGLDELVPDCIERIPLQPRISEAYVYERTADGGCSIGAPCIPTLRHKDDAESTWTLPP